MSTQQRSGYKVGSDIANMGTWFDRATGIAVLLALSVMVFMRRKVGFRRLGKGTLFGMTFCMLVANWFHNLHFSFLGGITSGSDDSLAYFAIAALGLGLWQRRKRIEEIRQGRPEHTFSPGGTWFDFLPIRADFIQRFVDPGVAFVAGAVLSKLGLGLGSWLMVAAVAFAIVEHAVNAKGVEVRLNDIDNGIEARLRAGFMTDYVTRESATRPQNDEVGSSIATGADAQLAAEIEKRRKSNAEGSIQ